MCLAGFPQPGDVMLHVGFALPGHACNISHAGILSVDPAVGLHGGKNVALRIAVQPRHYSMVIFMTDTRGMEITKS